MPTYEYDRIKVLAEQLAKAGIADDVAAQILAGGESIRKADSPQKKAAWMAAAMRRMDQMLTPRVRQAVRQQCACCLGGKRLQMSRAIAREHATLQERIAAANETRFVFGHAVTQQDDGRILVEFSPAGLDHYRCVCLPQAQEPMSITYCYCCGGHAKHHLQTALGRKLELKVRSSALASGGKKPCTFLFKILE
jgi:hypothetical protein